jgi:hypothetical protein
MSVSEPPTKEERDAADIAAANEQSEWEGEDRWEREEECMVDNCFNQSTHTLQWGILRMRYCSEHFVIKKESRDSGMNGASTTAKR